MLYVLFWGSALCELCTELALETIYLSKPHFPCRESVVPLPALYKTFVWKYKRHFAAFLFWIAVLGYFLFYQHGRFVGNDGQAVEWNLNYVNWIQASFSTDKLSQVVSSWLNYGRQIGFFPVHLLLVSSSCRCPLFEWVESETVSRFIPVFGIACCLKNRSLFVILWSHCLHERWNFKPLLDSVYFYSSKKPLCLAFFERIAHGQQHPFCYDSHHPCNLFLIWKSDRRQ